MTKQQQEHYNKFIQLAEKHGIACPDLKYFKINSLGELLKKYKEDEHLNNIPIYLFDNLYHILPKMDGKAPFYAPCIFKNLLIKKLIDKGLLNDEIAISNRFLLIIQEAKSLNNWIDCDVIQDAITEALKLRDSNDYNKILEAVGYLESAVYYRVKKDISRANYFNRLINELRELIQLHFDN